MDNLELFRIRIRVRNDLRQHTYRRNFDLNRGRLIEYARRFALPPSFGGRSPRD